MDCSCAYTLKKIIHNANRIRVSQGKKKLNYHQGRTLWLKLVNGYMGRKNQYLYHNRIGTSYIFTKCVANKISDKLAKTQYKFCPNIDSWKNCEWVQAA
jgi:hypothetical protein